VTTGERNFVSGRAQMMTCDEKQTTLFANFLMIQKFIVDSVLLQISQQPNVFIINLFEIPSNQR